MLGVLSPAQRSPFREGMAASGQDTVLSAVNDLAPNAPGSSQEQ